MKRSRRIMGNEKDIVFQKSPENVFNIRGNGKPSSVLATPRYFKGLDGLRTLAFLSVFFAHSFYSEVPAIADNSIVLFLRTIGHKGIYGVNFFFVLSGFLITYLLLLEIKAEGRISIRNFYIRRVLRIWPLYYLVVLIGFFVFPFVKKMLGGEITGQEHLLFYLLLINNYDTVPDSAVLGVLWSIAIEEQFYLVWPVIFRFVRVQHLKYVMIAIIVISSAWRMTPYYGYQDTLSCISDMAIGGLGAYWISFNNKVLSFIRSLKKFYVVLIYIAGLTLIYTGAIHSEQLRWLERDVFALFFLFVILEQIYCNNSFFKIEKIRTLTSLGKYTYGLYMLHFTAIYIVARVFKSFISPSLFHTLISETLLSLALSLILAYLSYTYFEKYFLRKKERFSMPLKKEVASLP